jgi:hypothetical protein
LIALVGCRDYGDEPAHTQDSSSYPSYLFFNYKAYDSLGALSATGSMVFTIYNSRVTGGWKFDGGREGTLLGTYDKGTIQIDLYPGYADHNLILTGKMTGETFSGEWVMYGWTVLGRGRFVATVNHDVIIN